MSTIMPRIASHVEQFQEIIQHHCSTAQPHLFKARKRLNTTLHHTKLHPKAALYTTLFLFTLIWLAIKLTRRLRTHAQPPLPNTPNLEKRSWPKPPARPFGGTSP
jgi:hypothetical protein